MGRRLKTYPAQSGNVTQVATTSTTDDFVTVPKSGRVVAAYFSSLAALSAHDSNYLGFSIQNLGLDGLGSTELLASGDANTTKATGGAALAANASRSLGLHGTPANRDVVEGQRLRIRYTATGTLAGAVTRPQVTLLIDANGQ